MIARTFTFTVQAAPSAAWLTGKAVNEWVTLPSPSTAPSVGLPSAQWPGGAGPRSGVIDAWGGAALRNNGSYYLLHGGGHADYGGNEIYSLQLSANSPTWVVEDPPTPFAQITEFTDFYADKKPPAIHTYYTMQYNNFTDQLVRVQGGQFIRSGTGMNTQVWNWATKAWNSEARTPAAPDGVIPYGVGSSVESGASVATDPATGDIYHWELARRFKWSNNAWSTLATTSVQRAYGPAVFDPVNGCIWNIGGYNAVAGTVAKWVIASGATSAVAVTGNATSVCTQTAMGAVYDPDLACVWIYAGDGVVRKFDPAALTINTVPIAGSGPGTNVSYGNTTGTWNRLQYVPALKGCVVTPAWAAPTFFFRTS